MLLALSMMVALIANPGSVSDETVLVKDGVSPAVVEQSPSVLGWQRMPAALVGEDETVVADVYLDLLATDPSTEPLAVDQWALEKLDIAGAWSHTLGNPQTVIAVVDSGLERTHPEFSGRIFTSTGEIAANGFDDDANGLVDDVSGWDIVDNDADPTDTSVGHGTEVTGVAVASLNSIGLAGVAPMATVLPIRACSTRCELIDVAWAVVYAVDMGADIINLSVGGFAEPGPLADAIDYAEAAGVLVVAAAGNGGADIDGSNFVPAGLPNPNLVAVAATNRDDRLWDSSNFGADEIDLGAPGIQIVSTTITSLGQYRAVSGTSFAAPHVSAVAALMLAVNPGLSPSELIRRLGIYGTSLPDLANTTVFGSRIRAHEAVVAARLDDIHESMFRHEIVWLATGGITKGCNPPANTMFCPQREVTRAEMAAFVDRALALATGPNVFTDDDASEFQPSINALAAAGITRGCNPPVNDHFCPDRLVSRAEMAAFLARALALTPGPDAFTDDSASIFQTDIDALASAGITHGCNPPANTMFCPERNVTRAEMAAFLHRALG
ncbi:MAG: S8 family serine peptidase [Acidimicrobiia bacterium]